MSYRKKTVKRSRQDTNCDFGLEPDEPTYEPVAIGTIKNAYMKTDPHCWGCRYYFGKTADDDNPHMNLLWACWVDNRNRLSSTELYKEMERVHYKTFVVPFQEIGKPFMIWTVEQIEKHLTEHLLDFDGELLDSYQSIKLVTRGLLDRVFQRDIATGEVSSNEEVMESWRKTEKLRQSTLLLINRKR